MIFGLMKSNFDIEIWDVINNKILDFLYIYVGILFIIYVIWFWKKWLNENKIVYICKLNVKLFCNKNYYW